MFNAETSKEIAVFLQDQLAIEEFFFLKNPRWILHAASLFVIAVTQVVLSFIPFLAPISNQLMSEGQSDLAFVFEALCSKKCHIKDWWWNHKVPSLVQTAR